MKKKIVVFSGAGLDAESGVKTFRDCENGMWERYNIEDVCTPEGLRKNYDLVINFYNERRTELDKLEPNGAHKLLATLEEDYEITNVTQNVTNLLERAGCSKIYHLHGELTKVRSIAYPDEIIEWGTKPITDEDRGKSNSKLRPHIVFFEEYPFFVTEAYNAIREADIMVVVGTSFNIGYTINLVNSCKFEIPVYFIDPKPSPSVFSNKNRVKMIPTKATEGVKQLFEILKQK